MQQLWQHHEVPGCLHSIAGLSDIAFLARGKRGLVFSAKHNHSPVVLKVQNPKSKSLGTLEKEAEFLRILNKEGIGPRLIDVHDCAIILEFIDGERILDFLSHGKRDDILIVLHEVLRQMFVMDCMGISKFEMQHPHKHILVEMADGAKVRRAVLIDFERCKKNLRPKNVTQFCQFMTSKEVSAKLSGKGVYISSDIREKVAGYKTKLEGALAEHYGSRKKIAQCLDEEYRSIMGCIK